MTSLPGAIDPTADEIRRPRRRRRREQGTFGPIRQGPIGFNQQNPFRGPLPGDPGRLRELQLQVQQAQTPEEKQRLLGLLSGEASGIQGRQQAGDDFLPVLTQFARAGIPLPGPVAQLGGLPTPTGPGPDPRSQGSSQQSPPPTGVGGVPQGPQQVQSVNGTGLTVGGPATQASLIALARPQSPVTQPGAPNNPLRTVSPA